MHEDINYLKQYDISSVLSIALGELYLAKPKNQLHFLGNWLVNHSASLKNQNNEVEKTELRESLREKYEKSLIAQRESEERLRAEAERLQKEENQLKLELSTTTDIDDYLLRIIEHLKTRTFAAAGYIGIQEKIKRQITPLDDEKGHIDDEAPLVIRYIEATSNSRFLIDQMLKEEEGQATWSIWKEDEEEEIQDEENQEETKKKPKVKVISIDDVVNDPRIKFFDVTKLGAYFAVPLTYKSCLSESSFDAAVEDSSECRKLRIIQEEEKIKYEASNKEEEEQKVFEEIKEAPYRTTEVRLVVAVDTLGQDRVFAEDQKNYMIEWIQFVTEQWERAETESLKQDVINYIPIKDKDQQKIHDKQVEWADEERNVQEDAIKSLHASLPEDLKQLEAQQALFDLRRNRLLGDIENLLKFTEFKLVKYLRVIQLALYLSGIPREEIIEPGTNMIYWKKAKKFVNEEFKEFLLNLKARGSKPLAPPAYAKTFKLERDLQKVPYEEVSNYSLSIAFLYKFIEQYFKLRVLDVTYRRKEYLAKSDQRAAIIRAYQELEERKNKYIEDTKEAYEKELEALNEYAEKPFFDMEKVVREFDEAEGNQPVEIPSEIIPEEDGDLDWEETNPS